MLSNYKPSTVPKTLFETINIFFNDWIAYKETKMIYERF
jgi:hypothetical protein